MGNLDVVEKNGGDSPSSDHQEVTDVGKVDGDSNTPVLEKNFSLFAACSIGLTTGNAWAVLGGGIV